MIYSVQEDRQHLVDLKTIRSVLDEAFMVASIVRKTTALERVRRASVSEELGLLDALDRYFENNPTLEPFMDDMKTYAQRLEHELIEEHRDQAAEVEK